LRILILNWRDIKNPSGGGAEILTHEMAKRWVKWGHQVTQISAGFKGGKKIGVVDGVKIIRLGNWYTVHFLALFYYWKYLRKQIDIIIDEVHWFPFFSGVYARKKTVLLACEVANRRFFTQYNYLLAYFLRCLEKIYLKIYKDLPTLTISPSTKEEFIKEGFKKEKITILPMGLTVPANLKIYPKEENPSLIYLGRINKLKGAEDAVEIFRIIKQKLPQAKFWFVGSGLPNYEKKIKQKAAEYGLGNSVKFFGFVSEKKKFELLSRAHILIVPSIHEGWGLIVPEAGLVKTPVVVYNVPGLRDVVENGVNGLVCKETTPTNLAENVIKLFKDQKLIKYLGEKAQKKSARMNWQKTAQLAVKVFKKNV
jgi:glycosyltransferase involved in cell wall biosynthesis